MRIKVASVDRIVHHIAILLSLKQNPSAQEFRIMFKLKTHTSSPTKDQNKKINQKMNSTEN